MSRFSSPSVLIPSGLLALGLIPFAATGVRLFDMGFATEITPDNARFFAAPAPILMHAAGMGLYMFLGAFQFSPGLRQRLPRWHQLSGRILVVAGLIGAIGGIWMTQTYPSQPSNPPELYGFRITFGLAFILCLLLGLRAILQRDVVRHRAWMMRAYAIGLGAGTTVFTFGLALLLSGGNASDQAFALATAAGWIINLTVAEWLIHRNSRRTSPSFART
jgi:uncharacterized membrane protein